MTKMIDEIYTMVMELRPFDDFDKDTDLIESDILDSLAIVQLITRIEELYSIKIDDEKVRSENFKSIKTIYELVSELSEKR